VVADIGVLSCYLFWFRGLPEGFMGFPEEVTSVGGSNSAYCKYSMGKRFCP
jgi:hypothetical protein